MPGHCDSDDNLGTNTPCRTAIYPGNHIRLQSCVMMPIKIAPLRAKCKYYHNTNAVI